MKHVKNGGAGRTQKIKDTRLTTRLKMPSKMSANIREFEFGILVDTLERK